MDMYAEQILEHSKNPRHTGSLPHATITHEEANLSCGDRVRMDLQIENDTLTDLAWTGSGCAISQAGMSLLSEAIIGRPLDALLSLTKDDVTTILGVPISERRMKCALLGLHTLQNAFRVHRGLPPRSWVETCLPAGRR